MKHKHYDCIVAWAEGKEIQVRWNKGVWFKLIDSVWSDNDEIEYRIKPELKPDVIRNFYLESNPLLGLRFSQAHTPIDLRGREFGGITCTFDGETGKLKSAEVI